MLAVNNEIPKPENLEPKEEDPQTQEKISQGESVIQRSSENDAEGNSETQELQVKKELEELRQTIENEPSSPAAPLSTKTLEERMTAYEQKHLPSYIAEQGQLRPVRSILGLVNKIRGYKTDPEEERNIPKSGPFLVISNHFGGESGIQLGLLKNHNAHLVASETLNWQRSGARNWLLKKMGFLSVRESLQNLDDQEKNELMTRVPKRAQTGYQQVIEREAAGDTLVPRKNIQQIVATLVHGDPVVMFPEGLFMYKDQPGLQKGYGGMEIIAREYKRVTGKELPILPTAITKNGEGELGRKQIRVGAPFTFSENQGQESNTDWAMQRVASLLPEAEKGYYRESP